MNKATTLAAVALAVVALGLAGCSSTTITPAAPAPTSPAPTPTPTPTVKLKTISTAEMCTKHLDGFDSMLTLVNKDLTLANADPAKVAAYKAEFIRLSQQAPPPANTAFGTLAENMAVGEADKDVIADAGQTIVDMCQRYVSSLKAGKN